MAADDTITEILRAAHESVAAADLPEAFHAAAFDKAVEMLAAKGGLIAAAPTAAEAPLDPAAQKEGGSAPGTAEPKTLAKIADSPFSADEDPVFATANGRPFPWRNVEGRGMDRAVEVAGLDKVPGKRRPTLHDLRDTFASALIAEGLDVVQMSKQLGHADPAITLRVYADLFNRARGAERTVRAIDSAFGTALEPSGGDRRRDSICTEEQNTAEVLVLATGGD